MTAPDSPAAIPTGRPRILGRLLRDIALAAQLLFPLSSQRPTHFQNPGRIIPWITPLGLLIGLAWTACFRAAWRLYGEETISLRSIPALAILLLESLITGPFLILGFARTINLLAGHSPLAPSLDPHAPLSPVGTLVLALTLLAQWALIATLTAATPWWPEGDWRSHFNFLYPRPIYRPLILAPLWGRWGILLALTVGRPSRNAEPEIKSLINAMRPTKLLLHLLFPLVLTAIYCSRARNFLTGLILGTCVFGLSFLVAVALSRRGGGHTRSSVFAVGQMAQLAFLALYRAFWPLIHE